MTAYNQQSIPPVGVPIPGCGFVLATKRFFQGYAVFSGRSTRSEYWWSYLAISILMLVLALILGIAIGVASSVSEDTVSIVGGVVGSLISLVSLGLLLPSIAVYARRLRDAGFSPLFLLLSIVGLGIVPFIMSLLPSKPETAGFGAPVPPQQYSQA